MSHGIEMVEILYENRKKANIILGSIFDKESNTENASKLVCTKNWEILYCLNYSNLV